VGPLEVEDTRRQNPQAAMPTAPRGCLYVIVNMARIGFTVWNQTRLEEVGIRGEVCALLPANRGRLK
jgi:hypothetical protein